MLQEKGIRRAFLASLLINMGCIAWIGGSDLVHPRNLPIPPHADDTANLHPVKLSIEKLATAASRQDGGAAGDKQGSGKSESLRGEAKAGGADSLDGTPDRTAANKNSDGPEQSSTGKNQVSRLQNQPLSRTRLDPLDHHGATPQSTQALNQSTHPFQLAENERQMLAAEEQRERLLPNGPHAPREDGHPAENAALQKRQEGGKSFVQNGTTSKGMTVVTAPNAYSPQGGVHRMGQPGNSYSPHRINFPEMKVDLGTVHVRRPAHGTVGGGYADMRKVEITAHYVKDDPNAGPAPQSKHLPSLVLAGHNHITGSKYCVAAAPSIPSSGSIRNDSSQGRIKGDGSHQGGASFAEFTAAASTRISQPYAGHGPALRVNEKHMADPGSSSEIPSDVLHLPNHSDDIRGMTPGARVPVEDRRLVSDPRPHKDITPAGLQDAPMPQFTVAPHDIGSMSDNGSVNWGKPHPVKHKKMPYGGDGTGLLGLYYTGQFDQLVFKRTDRNIDYDWSGTGPGPLMPKTQFTVRWLGKLVPRYTDSYTIMTTSDDGVRVWLDDKLIISNWTIHAATEDTATVNLQAGQPYNLKVEYFEKNGVSYEVMKLYWESPQQPREYIPEQCLRYPALLDSN